MWDDSSKPQTIPARHGVAIGLARGTELVIFVHETLSLLAAGWDR